MKVEVRGPRFEAGGKRLEARKNKLRVGSLRLDAREKCLWLEATGNSPTNGRPMAQPVTNAVNSNPHEC